MYSVSFQSKLWRNGLTYSKRLVRLHSDYIKRTYHDNVVLQQSHKLSQKQIELINLKEEENPNKKAERIAIVVPLANPLTGAIVGGTTTSVVDDALKNDSKQTKGNRAEDTKWAVTPSEDMSRLGKHYLMLSKSRLTGKGEGYYSADGFEHFFRFFSSRCYHFYGWIRNGAGTIRTIHIYLVFRWYRTVFGCC